MRGPSGESPDGTRPCTAAKVDICRARIPASKDAGHPARIDAERGEWRSNAERGNERNIEKPSGTDS